MPSFLSGGHSIRVDYHEPPTAGRHAAILLIHGSGGNIGFWTDLVMPYLTNVNIALYAVHYFDRTGTTRATTATILDGVHWPQWLETIADALAHIRSRPTVDAGRIALLGISLGAFLALSSGVEPANRVRAIVELSGGIPEDYAPKVTREFPPTLIVHGSDDTIVPVTHANALESLLKQHGVPHQVEILPNQGHWFDPGAQMRILMATAQFLGEILR
ncbi:MAG: hypothetical protein NVSMB62_26860 [Acidobacteriaceae bacterium]